MDPMERERDVERWLDSALIQFGKAEPRAGLESRVFANLQAERNRLASRRRWWWAVGAATALAAVVLAVWVGESARERNPGSTAGNSTRHREEVRRSMRPRPAPQAAAPQVAAIQVTRPAREVAQRRPANRPIRPVAGTPKLAQFPSPQPLSEQERILASYVAQYPETAALVAQARAEALQRDREEEAAEAATGSMR
jgi:hypothetical protein